jgi:putative sigma-54 modulation protein
MRLELTGRHLDITPALRRLVTRKLDRLDRLLSHNAVSAHVVLTREKRLLRTDLTLHARGEKFLHGASEASTWVMSVGQAVEKIVQQVSQMKGKWEEWKRRRASGTPAEAPGGAIGRAIGGDGGPPGGAKRLRPKRPRIFQSSRQVIKSMSVAEAVREAEVTVDGVVVFRDAETDSISVFYRRATGELALIETEL